MHLFEKRPQNQFGLPVLNLRRGGKAVGIQGNFGRAYILNAFATPPGRRKETNLGPKMSFEGGAGQLNPASQGNLVISRKSCPHPCHCLGQVDLCQSTNSLISCSLVKQLHRASFPAKETPLKGITRPPSSRGRLKQSFLTTK